MRAKINNQTANYYECDKVLPNAKEFLFAFDVQRFVVFILCSVPKVILFDFFFYAVCHFTSDSQTDLFKSLKKNKINSGFSSNYIFCAHAMYV